MPRPAFAVPLPAPSAPRRAARTSRRAPRAQITRVSDAQLSTLLATRSVVVLKCFAAHCAGCRGVEPKYRKIAAAYARDDAAAPAAAPAVEFCEIDYRAHERFCHDLGVRALPFFAIWRDGKYEGGESMGWTSVGNKLVDRIDKALRDAAAAAHDTPEPAR